MRVCETRKRASYRSVAAVPDALWSMSLILIGGSDLTTSHTCLSAWERKTTLVRIRVCQQNTPGRTRMSLISKEQSTRTGSAIRLGKNCRLLGSDHMVA